MSFSELTINDFMDRLASKDPTPGGGSTAGLSSALAASLLLMVLNLTKQTDDNLTSLKSELLEIKTESLELINEDAKAFQGVMKSYRMAKDTEVERNKRSREIQAALRNATITPYKIMKLGLRLLELGKKIVLVGNPNAISDVGVAGLMAFSAVKGGNYNVLINLKLLKDEEFISSLRRETKDIMLKSAKLAEEIDSALEEKLL